MTEVVRPPMVVVTLPAAHAGFAIGWAKVTVDGVPLVTTGLTTIEVDGDGLMVVAVRLPVTRVEQAAPQPPITEKETSQ